MKNNKQITKKIIIFATIIFSAIFILNINVFGKNSILNNDIISKDLTVTETVVLKDSYKDINETNVYIEEGVTTIEEYAFRNSSITNLYLPSTIKSIGNYAFKNGKMYGGLKNVYYSGTIEQWCNIDFDGEYANPISKTNFYMLDSNGEYSLVTEIEIPNTITEIGEYQFDSIKNIEKFTFSNSIKKIGFNAFSRYDYNTRFDIYFKGNVEDWCEIEFASLDSVISRLSEKIYFMNEDGDFYEIEDIVIPNTITKIGEYQFYGFSNIKKIKIPESVTSIGGSAFGSSNLQSIEFSKYLELEEYPDVFPNTGYDIYFNGTLSDWIQFTPTSNLLYYAKDIYLLDENNEYKIFNEIIIPEGTTIIKNSHFYCFNSLDKVVIPEGVTTIGSSAFSRTKIKDLYLPSTLESLKMYCFCGYGEYVENVYYSGTIEQWCNIEIELLGNPLEQANFYMLNEDNEFELVTEINIPNTVTEIGDYNFISINNIDTVIIPNSIKELKASVFSGYYNRNIKQYFNGTLEEWCQIKMGDNASHLGYAIDQFYLLDENGEYYELVDLNIPNSITKIGKYQFYGMDSIKTITLPESVTTIYDDAFVGCNNVEYVSFTKNLKEMNYAFYQMPNMKYLYYKGTSEDWIKFKPQDNLMSQIQNIYFVDENGDPYTIEEINIPEGITEIYEYQFCNFKDLKEIVLPESLEKFGNYCFYNNDNLNKIYINSKIIAKNFVNNKYYLKINNNAFLYIRSDITDLSSYIQTNYKKYNTVIYNGEEYIEYSIHSLKDGDSKDPTCGVDGYTNYRYCTDCDFEIKDVIESLGNHEYTDWVTIKEATETEEGTIMKECKKCSKIVVKKIPISTHIHEYSYEITNPTCTEKGYTTYTCSCGDSYVSDETEAKGHTYSDWVVVKEATEEETGLKEKECIRCNDKITEEISKLEHTHTYTSVVTKPTCVDKGYTTYTCKCGDSYVSDETNALGHTYGDWKVVKEATETETGLKERKCKNCNELKTQTIPTLSHTHTYTSVVTKPTCVDKGYTTYTCKCGDCYKDNEVAALGHTYGDWKVVKEATEEETGLKERKCNICSELETQTIPSLSHTHSYTSVVTNPTCTEKGYTTYTCTCGDSYKDNEVDAIGHTYSDWKVVKEATETETGLKEKECSVCNDKVTEEISKLEHTHKYNDGEIVKEATVNETGIMKYTCTECGHSYEIEIPVKEAAHTKPIYYILIILLILLLIAVGIFIYKKYFQKEKKED